MTDFKLHTPLFILPQNGNVRKLVVKFRTSMLSVNSIHAHFERNLTAPYFSRQVSVDEKLFIISDSF